MPRRLLFILVTSFFLFAGKLSAADSSQDTIRVTVNGALPHILGWDGKRFTGSYRSEVKCIIDQLPYLKRIQMVPIARLGKLMALGKTDLVLLLAQSDKRDDYGTYSTPIVVSDNVLVTQLSKIPTTEDAKVMQVATMRGSVFVELIKHDLLANVIEVNDWYSALEMLARGRIQGVYSAQIVLDREVDSEILKPFTILPVSRNNGGAYINRRHPMHDQLVNQFNRAVEQCVNRI